MDGPLDEPDRNVTDGEFWEPSAATVVMDGPPGSSTVTPSGAPTTIIEGPMLPCMGSSTTMDEAWAPPAAVAAKINAARMRMPSIPPQTLRQQGVTLPPAG